MTKCVFCGEEIEKGVGTLYVFKTGKAVWFCSMKCQKNMLKLGRKPLETKWTSFYQNAKNKKE